VLLASGRDVMLVEVGHMAKHNLHYYLRVLADLDPGEILRLMAE
jgi:hypothetical protein